MPSGWAEGTNAVQEQIVRKLRQHAGAKVNVVCTSLQIEFAVRLKMSRDTEWQNVVNKVWKTVELAIEADSKAEEKVSKVLCQYRDVSARTLEFIERARLAELAREKKTQQQQEQQQTEKRSSYHTAAEEIAENTQETFRKPPTQKQKLENVVIRAIPQKEAPIPKEDWKGNVTKIIVKSKQVRKSFI